LFSKSSGFLNGSIKQINFLLITSISPATTSDLLNCDFDLLQRSPLERFRGVMRSEAEVVDNYAFLDDICPGYGEEGEKEFVDVVPKTDGSNHCAGS
jgi:hypothetical protein